MTIKEHVQERLDEAALNLAEQKRNRYASLPPLDPESILLGVMAGRVDALREVRAYLKTQT